MALPGQAMYGNGSGFGTDQLCLVNTAQKFLCRGERHDTRRVCICSETFSRAED